MYEREYEDSLVKMRDMIFKVRDQKETKGAGERVDVAETTKTIGGSKVLLKSLERASRWRGRAELEEMCAIFTRYMTAPPEPPKRRQVKNVVAEEESAKTPMQEVKEEKSDEENSWLRVKEDEFLEKLDQFGNQIDSESEH